MFGVTRRVNGSPWWWLSQPRDARVAPLDDPGVIIRSYDRGSVVGGARPRRHDREIAVVPTGGDDRRGVGLAAHRREARPGGRRDSTGDRRRSGLGHGAPDP